MAENTTNTIVKDNVYNVNEAPHAATNRRSKFSADADIYRNTGENPKHTLGGDILSVPNWTISDFIRERTKYRSIGADKGIGSEYFEPGTYFYKVFFNFNTNFGLFGGIINGSNENVSNTSVKDGPKEFNTASMYLENNCKSQRFSEYYRKVLRQKQISLFRFTQILNYLTLECPWVFKEVGGLENIGAISLVDIAKEEGNQIQIAFNEDAIDMRISTIIDLYKHACFDTINQKEIIPENLRKFDMSIIVFNPPIYGVNIEEVEKYSESKTDKNEKSFEGYETKYGSLTAKDMPFKCIILKNCEFNVDGLKSLPDSMTNAEGFNNNIVVNIKYQRSFVYSLNNIYGTETLEGYYNADEIALFTGETDDETPNNDTPQTNQPEKQLTKKIGPVKPFYINFRTVYDKPYSYEFDITKYGTVKTYTAEADSETNAYNEVLKKACADLGIDKFGTQAKVKYHLSEINYYEQKQDETIVYSCSVNIIQLKESVVQKKHYTRKVMVDTAINLFDCTSVENLNDTSMTITGTYRKLVRGENKGQPNTNTHTETLKVIMEKFENGVKTEEKNTDKTNQGTGNTEGEGDGGPDDTTE